MIDAQQLKADLSTHHIEGYAREDPTRAHFDIPLMSEVVPGLWQGGCIDAVNLQGFFQHIVSLYPWERYNPGKMLDSFVEVKLYDGPTVPDERQLFSLARHINFCREHGAVLVHCQAGLNRSGLLTGLALVLDGMTPNKAIKLLREKRPAKQVLCNQKFESWLRSVKVPRKRTKSTSGSCSSSPSTTAE